MTLSLTARCPQTGALGIAIASSSPAVAARCAHVRAGVGAVATQNVTDPRLGPRGLDLLQSGLGAEAALSRLVAEAPHAAWRQLAVVWMRKGAAVFSGAQALGIHGGLTGAGVAVAGNLLSGDAVPPAMLAAFADGPDTLADRLLAGLRAGLAAGGEVSPLRSAGLLIAHDVAWPVADLRIDWEETDPIAALCRLWALWQPQMHAYVQRALDPDAAPGF